MVFLKCIIRVIIFDNTQKELLQNTIKHSICQPILLYFTTIAIIKMNLIIKIFFLTHIIP